MEFLLGLLTPNNCTPLIYSPYSYQNNRLKTLHFTSLTTNLKYIMVLETLHYLTPAYVFKPPSQKFSASLVHQSFRALGNALNWKYFSYLPYRAPPNLDDCPTSCRSHLGVLSLGETSFAAASCTCSLGWSLWRCPTAHCISFSHKANHIYVFHVF